MLKGLGAGKGYRLQYSCWENLMTEEPSKSPSVGLQESETTERLTYTHTHTHKQETQKKEKTYQIKINK